MSYSKVETAEAAGSPPKKKGFGLFSTMKKGQGEGQDVEEGGDTMNDDDMAKMVSQAKTKTSAREQEKKEQRTDEMTSVRKSTEDAGFAMTSVTKAQFMVKVMAVLQNPTKIGEIINAKNFSDGLEDHYGTDDPQKVAELILHDLQDAVKNGTWSVGRLAFFGGCYGVVAGGMNMMPPASIFRVFTPLAGINMLFLFIFGVVIMTVESDGDTISANLKKNVNTYCAAMETIWGRGLFYMYVGVTQILGPTNTLYGYYMLLVGCTYLGLYRAMLQHISKMQEIFQDDSKLEEAFAGHAGVDGVMGRSELAKLFKDVGLELTHAEMEMMLRKLDPDHDGYISLSELKRVLRNHEEANQVTYVIGPVARLDPSKGDTFKVLQTKNKVVGATRDGDGHAELDWSKVKKAA